MGVPSGENLGGVVKHTSAQIGSPGVPAAVCATTLYWVVLLLAKEFVVHVHGTPLVMAMSALPIKSFHVVAAASWTPHPAFSMPSHMAISPSWM
jgi:hypothetical protein